MKDCKIDSILDNHISDWDLETEYIKVIRLLGKEFIETLTEIYGEECIEIIIEAKNLLQNYLQNKSFKIEELEMYKSCLLKSFINRPELDINERKEYIDIYKFCLKSDDLISFDTHEKEITKKTILWYENYKQKNKNANAKESYEIASLAIKDQVYEKWLDAYQNGQQKTLRNC